MAGLLIGHREDPERSRIGFRGEPGAAPPGEEVVYDAEGHLMTIAPTGAGKGVSCVVPAILRHRGPVVVLDLKGENYAMTREHRARTGSRVSCIDPFGLAKRITEGQGADPGHEISGFNPFDLLPFLSDDRDTACRALADKMIPPNGHSADPFWRNAAVGVLAALIECYDRLGGPLRSISAIIHDLGFEMDPGSLVGEIGPGADALSRFAASPRALDILDAAGCTASDVWSSYRLSGAGTRDEDMDLSLLTGDPAAERAIRMALDLYPDRDRSKDAAAIADILDRSAGETHCRAVFEKDLAMGFGMSQEDMAFLWDFLEDARAAKRSSPMPGCLAATRGRHEAPEHFPLALHRLANHPGTMARSTAVQAFNSDRTWASILLSLRADLAEFSGRSIARTLGGENGIDLEGLRRGDNQSIYIAFPPDRARSHASLFRVVVDGILSVVCARETRPRERTLLLLDEIAQLGRLDLLVTAKTLLRGYGVQVWSFWQDISQIQANYPKDWPTIINNCRVIEVFGRGMGTMADALGRALDVAPGRIDSLRPDQALVWIDGGQPEVLRRPVCYEHAEMRWLCRAGPFALPASPDATPGPQADRTTVVRDLFDPFWTREPEPAIRDLFDGIADPEDKESEGDEELDFLLKLFEEDD